MHFRANRSFFILALLFIPNTLTADNPEEGMLNPRFAQFEEDQYTTDILPPKISIGSKDFRQANDSELINAVFSEENSRCDGPSGTWLAGLVAKLRAESQLVGLGAIVMIDKQTMAIAVDGERKKDSGVLIELGDCWHVGSVTKSVTATMIARLVDSGQMQWSDSIGMRFPDSPVQADWKDVTLPQLLTHTSGAPANFPLWMMLLKPASGQECTAKRRQAVINVLSQKPVIPPGQSYSYSNIGYTIAGAMAEASTNMSWEDLVTREVFIPLELRSGGFGPPQSLDGTIDEPRGHLHTRNGETSVSEKFDITPIIGPAGTIHMTLKDLCAFGFEHLQGEMGKGKLLGAETYKRLHTPNLENYAYGWVKNKPSNKIPYTTYWHNGSNTMWYALLVFIPERNMTVAITSNDGDVASAQSAGWSIVEESMKQFDEISAR